MRSLTVVRLAMFVATHFLLGSVGFAQSSQAGTHGVVDWSTDLTAAKDSSHYIAEAVRTPASGKAAVAFDFDHQNATFTVHAKELSGVQTVELRTARQRGDVSGPTILTLYDAAKDGAFPGEFSKTVTGGAFKQAKGTVLNGRGVIVITTKAHPEGELAGVITMHKHYE